MDLRQLEYFVRVAEMGSFTRAAKQLGIAQPALSRQVRLLEVELRQNLLVRNGRGAVPTEAGKLLLEHSRGILHQVQRATDDLSRVRGALFGRVAVGLPTSVARVLAVPLTREFRRQMPQATMALSEGLSAAMLESLANGRLDIALIYGASASHDVELTALLDEAVYLVSPAAKPDAPPQDGLPKALGALPLSALTSLPLIIPTKPNALRNLVESELGALGLQALIALEIDSIFAILDLVADGLGHAVLPQSAITAMTMQQRFDIRPIQGLQSRLSLGLSAHRPSTATQRAVQDLIVRLTPELIQTSGRAQAASTA